MFVDQRFFSFFFCGSVVLEREWNRGKKMRELDRMKKGDKEDLR